MRLLEWRKQAAAGRRRLGRIHEVVASTIFPSWHRHVGRAPTARAMQWVSGLTADLCWSMESLPGEKGVRYAEIYVQQVEYQLGISRSAVLAIIADLHNALETAFPRGHRREPYFDLYLAKDPEHVVVH